MIAAWRGTLPETASDLSLAMAKRIERPSIRGRIDHLAVDIVGERLFVAALGSDALEVIRLRRQSHQLHHLLA